MASAAMILGLATSDSLVIIDELGRGTSPSEGVGISHAIAESLIGIKAFTFFATHFHDLTTTLSRHPSVVQLHLSVQKSKQTASNFGMQFNYRILDGPPDEFEHYGLELARLADLPTSVREEAERIAEKLSMRQAERRESGLTNKVALRRKALVRLHARLRQAADHSTLPEEDLARYLSTLQQEILGTLGDTLVIGEQLGEQAFESDHSL